MSAETTADASRTIASRRRRRVALASLLVGAAVLVALEGLLRLAGKTARPPLHRGTLEPAMHVPDAELGWVPRPGTYTYPGYSSGAPPVTVTFWPDRARATRPVDDARGDEIVLVGDSMVMGWAVSDGETFAWQLQSRLPVFDVRNYGVPGYSTYQSALRLRRVLASARRPPRVAIYGFGEWQAMRNVALPVWLMALLANSQDAFVALPYCRLADDGGLACEPPTSFRPWPGASISALVATAQQAFLGTVAARREREIRPVTERLFTMMDEVARAGRSTLVIVLLGEDPGYREALRRSGIRFIDCGRPVERSARVRGESHPDASVHLAWARCIAEGLAADGLAS